LLNSRQDNYLKEYATISKDNVVELSGQGNASDPLTKLLRTGARELIKRAIEAELAGYIETFQDRRLPDGRAAVVRNGYQPERNIQTGIGPVTVKIPKVRAKDGHPVVFHSALVPPYVRKTRSVEAALPWLYLKGISTGEMAGALEVMIGPEARGMSASTIARLKRCWAEDYEIWRKRRLDKGGWDLQWSSCRKC
jgi:transposase-like protein